MKQFTWDGYYEKFFDWSRVRKRIALMGSWTMEQPMKYLK